MQRIFFNEYRLFKKFFANGKVSVKRFYNVKKEKKKKTSRCFKRVLKKDTHPEEAYFAARDGRISLFFFAGFLFFYVG